MPDALARRRVLRPRRGHEDGRVTFGERFFDLVFVLAVTLLA